MLKKGFAVGMNRLKQDADDIVRHRYITCITFDPCFMLTEFLGGYKEYTCEIRWVENKVDKDTFFRYMKHNWNLSKEELEKEYFDYCMYDLYLSDDRADNINFLYGTANSTEKEKNND